MSNAPIPRKDLLRIAKYLALVCGARGDIAGADAIGRPKFIERKHMEWALGFFSQDTRPSNTDASAVPTLSDELVQLGGVIVRHIEEEWTLPTLLPEPREGKPFLEKIAQEVNPTFPSFNPDEWSIEKRKALATLHIKRSYDDKKNFTPLEKYLKDNNAEAHAPFALNVYRMLTEQVLDRPGQAAQDTKPAVPKPTPAEPSAPSAAESTPPSPTPAPPQPSGLGQSANVQALRKALEAQVLDQPLAIRELTEELQAREWGLTPDNTPAMFLLAGPPGHGKSHLTRVLAAASSARPVLVLNMAAMTSYNEGFGLVGLRHGYSHAGPGKLTEFARNNPEGIVILDKFDRAHPNVQNLLIPLFTSGELLDEHGWSSGGYGGQPTPATVSFKKNWIFLIASNGEGAYSAADYEQHYATDLASGTSYTAARLLADVTMPVSTGNEKEHATSSAGPQSTGLGDYLATCKLLPFHEVGLPGLVQITRNSVERFKTALASKGVSTPWPADMQEQLCWALTLSAAPDITPLDAELAVTRELLATITQTASTEPLTQLGLSVDTTGADWLHSYMQGTPPPQHVKRTLFRRNQRLSFKVLTQTASAGEQPADATPPAEKSTFGRFLSAVTAPFQSGASADTPSKPSDSPLGKHAVLALSEFALVTVPNAQDHGHDTGINLAIPSIRFADIKGHQHVKARLSEVKALLQPPLNAANGQAPLPPQPPKGMLLHGRPGTGKTMLAKALAAETDMPFIAVTGPQLLSIDTVRKVFRLAHKYAPSILFIDEIDALGVRGSGGADVIINQLLAEIDGFKTTPDGNVFVLAATNFPGKVDPAITRSGRLDWVVEVPPLDKGAREHFFNKIQQALGPAWPVAPTNLMQQLVQLSVGMSGADLEKLQRELQMLVLRRHAAHQPAQMTLADLLDGINDIRHGSRLKKTPLAAQLQATAYHEAGHAVVSLALNPQVAVGQVTIGARGSALGFTAFSAEDLPPNAMTHKEVMDMMCIALAGRVAENRQFPLNTQDLSGGPDAGAASDLAQATQLAWTAITQWGLDDDFGWVSLEPLGKNAPAHLTEKAAQRVEHWLRQARVRTEQCVVQHWTDIERLAQRLIAEETVLAPTLGGATDSDH